MIHIDMRDLRKLEDDLRTLAGKAVPFAVRSALTSSAFEARKIWQAEIDERFILRNKFVQGSIRVEKARSLNVRTMKATVGSIAEFMPKQEFGGRESKAVPTEVAAGQPLGSQPRLKTVRAPNKLSAIRLTDRNRTGSRKVRNRIGIRRALKAGQKVVLLETERGKGLFRITGGRRKPQFRMIWDLRKGSHRIPPSPTLQPTLKKLQPKLLGIHRKAWLEQLKRHGVFGY